MKNPLDKTVRIPVRIVNGKVKYFYGGDLPDIKNISIGELIIPNYAVKDQRYLELAQMESTIELFPRKSSLMIGVNKNKVPDALNKYVHIENTHTLIEEVFVEVELWEPLYLQLRGSKKSVLCDVDCFIPSLKKEAKSLNNAYTIISTSFEPHRRSHTGNIFDKCYYLVGKEWYPLENLRQKHESEFEEKFFLDYKVFQLNPSPVIEEKDRQISLFDMHDQELIKSIINMMRQNQAMTGLEIKEFFKKQENHQLKDWVETLNYLLDKEIFLEKEE